MNTNYINDNKTITWYYYYNGKEKEAYYQGNLKDSVYSYFALF